MTDRLIVRPGYIILLDMCSLWGSRTAIFDLKFTNWNWSIQMVYGLWRLTLLSTIFQLYRGCRNRSTRRKPPTYRKSMTVNSLEYRILLKKKQDRCSLWGSGTTIFDLKSMNQNVSILTNWFLKLVWLTLRWSLWSLICLIF
jgi:hypothetical protein